MRSPTAATSALAVLAAIAGLSGCGGDTGVGAKAREAAAERAAQARSVASDAGLGSDVADLIGDAVGAGGQTFTVTYDDGAGAISTLVQDPPRRRLDVRKDEVIRAAFVIERGTFSCTQTQGAWVCGPSTSAPPAIGPFAATDLERTISNLTAARATYDFTTESRPLAGTSARCLVTTRKPEAAADPALGDRGVLCIAKSGAVLLVEAPGQALRAVSYRASTDDRAFDLPAEPA